MLKKNGLKEIQSDGAGWLSVASLMEKSEKTQEICVVRVDGFRSPCIIKTRPQWL